jgi:hypothetical protein
MSYSPLLAYISLAIFVASLVFLILYYFALELAYFFKLFYEMLSIITLLYLCVSCLDHSSSIQYLLKNSNASTLTMHFSNKTPWIPPRLFTPKKGYIVFSLASKIFLFLSKKNWL